MTTNRHPEFNLEDYTKDNPELAKEVEKEMSKNYIIKNCPAILKMSKVCDDYRTTRDNPKLCKNINDCVIKQIVEKCKDKMEEFNSASVFAQEILDLLQIEEVS